MLLPEIQPHQFHSKKTEDVIGFNDFWVVKLLPDECYASTEICNAIDDDCNGLIDDNVEHICEIISVGPTTFCQGGSVELTATYTGTNVQWKKDGIPIIGATFSNYTVTTKGNYSCETFSTCDTVQSNEIFVNVNKNPSAFISPDGPTIFCTGGSVLLNVTPVGGSTYQWYKGASPIAGAISLSYTATTSGNYKCRVTKAATGCFKNSNAIAVSVTCREENNIIENTFSLYPNPANNFITIETDFSTKKTIYLTDALGQIVKTITTSENNITIDLQGIASGVYFIKMEDGINSVAQKFIKQ
ncbi:MAG: T9SS type A sorting domain-containing protein [Bacteroidetes bacterium]|nr:T9SS type A sorting domain-containing protein [Bacteroidota bacterium]